MYNIVLGVWKEKMGRNVNLIYFFIATFLVTFTVATPSFAQQSGGSSSGGTMVNGIFIPEGIPDTDLYGSVQEGIDSVGEWIDEVPYQGMITQDKYNELYAKGLESYEQGYVDEIDKALAEQEKILESSERVKGKKFCERHFGKDTVLGKSCDISKAKCINGDNRCLCEEVTDPATGKYGKNIWINPPGMTVPSSEMVSVGGPSVKTSMMARTFTDENRAPHTPGSVNVSGQKSKCDEVQEEAEKLENKLLDEKIKDLLKHDMDMFMEGDRYLPDHEPKIDM
jgi:hypothetical protein